MCNYPLICVQLYEYFVQVDGLGWRKKMCNYPLICVQLYDYFVQLDGLEGALTNYKKLKRVENGVNA